MLCGISWKAETFNLMQNMIHFPRKKSKSNTLETYYQLVYFIRKKEYKYKCTKINNSRCLL